MRKLFITIGSIGDLGCYGIACYCCAQWTLPVEAVVGFAGFCGLSLIGVLGIRMKPLSD